MNTNEPNETRTLVRIAEIAYDDAHWHARKSIVGITGYIAESVLEMPSANRFGSCTLECFPTPQRGYTHFCFHKVRIESTELPGPRIFHQDYRMAAAMFIREMQAWMTTLVEKGWEAGIAFDPYSDDATILDDSWLEGKYDPDTDELIDPTKTFDEGQRLIANHHEWFTQLHNYTWAEIQEGLWQLMKSNADELPKFCLTAEELHNTGL